MIVMINDLSLMIMNSIVYIVIVLSYILLIYLLLKYNPITYKEDYEENPTTNNKKLD